tara:strand:- start:195 stop:353 length:159 start_codon:yes stop_codon:yes gene_type:complete
MIIDLELESGLEVCFIPEFKVPNPEKEEYIPYRYRYSLKGKKKLTRGIRKYS